MKELFKGSMTIPNLLSIIRIFLIPFFIVYFNEGDYIMALSILAVSGVTDLLDGKIARHFNQISALGKILDPVADKLTQITLAVMLYITFSSSQSSIMKTFSWIFLVFLFKELLMILGGIILLMNKLRPVAAELYGKIATFAFYAVMIIILAFGPDVGAFKALWEMSDFLTIVLVASSAVLTAVAFFSYFPPVIRELNKTNRNKK